MLNHIQDWLSHQGLEPFWALLAGYLIITGSITVVSITVNYAARRYILHFISALIAKSRSEWDDILLQSKFFHMLSHIVPAFVIYYSASLLPTFTLWIQRLAVSYMIVIGLLTINAFLNGVVIIYQRRDISRHRPIKGYVQVLKIFVFILGSIFIISILVERSPVKLLGSIGALTAILLLVFKDTILGLVASVQISMNNMIRIGDWIEMPKYDADGDVIDISLHTVKVRNWDKTITAIPAYAFISDSFKNWRGMTESGGRRIKRAIYIDVNSIKFCTDAMLETYEQFQVIREYIRSKREDIHRYNIEHGFDSTENINRRSLTNIGTYRAYITHYLKNHPKIHQQLTFLVRQLPPGEHGLPIEIYVFTTDIVWANYEAIQADIFDHLLAIAPQFDLRIFQIPSGHDVQALRTSP